MKKALLILSSVLAFSFASHAQKGNNQIGVAFEAGIPTGDDANTIKTGFGGSIKGLYGVGTAGQISLTTGYTTFKIKEMDESHTSIIPILAGYRHNFGGFFVEPQVGYGIYGAKVSYMGNSESSSDGAFTYAIGIGYKITNVELGARYQAGSKNGTTTGIVGLHLGYNFSLGK